MKKKTNMKNENISTKMKDSGIEWIGEIPEEWGVRRINHFFVNRKHKNKGMEENNLLSLSYGNIVRKNIETKEGLLPDSFETYNIIESGDIVFRLTDLQNDKHSLRTGLCKEKGIITSAYITLITPKDVNCVYMHYLFHIYDICKVFYNMGDGVRQGMNYDDLCKLSVLIPPLTTQQNIATFLDKKCAAIDSAVEKELLLIEKLKSYKQSVITQAVTKGIRPNRKMKQSGIEWIGEIPQEWEVRRIKFSAKTRNEKYSELYGKLDYFGLENIESQSAKYIATDNIYDIEQAQICKKGDIAFGKLRPYLAKIFEVPKTECCSSEFVLFHNFLGINTFYKYLFLSHGFINIVDSSTYVTKMPRANADFIKNLFIPVPPFPTQQNIATFLDKKCTAIESAISKKTSLIDKLKEYKKSLIYECVTGKRECCNF